MSSPVITMIDLLMWLLEVCLVCTWPEVVATGFDAATGMVTEGVAQAANLLLTDRGFTLVLRLFPSAAGGDCF